jgi:hypothetical protein
VTRPDDLSQPAVERFAAPTAAPRPSWPHVRASVRTRGLEPRCEWCRRPTAPVSEADRPWWLERFSLEEIRVMAAAIWPAEVDPPVRARAYPLTRGPKAR